MDKPDSRDPAGGVLSAWILGGRWRSVSTDAAGGVDDSDTKGMSYYKVLVRQWREAEDKEDRRNKCITKVLAGQRCPKRKEVIRTLRKDEENGKIESSSKHKSK